MLYIISARRSGLTWCYWWCIGGSGAFASRIRCPALGCRRARASAAHWAAELSRGSIPLYPLSKNENRLAVVCNLWWSIGGIEP